MELSMQDMKWPDLEDPIARQRGVILVVGATEQHGPHLPLGTDLYIPLEIAYGVARRTGMLVAPPVWYGYKSMPRTGGGPDFVGTISLNLSTLQGLLHDITSGLLNSGFRNLLILSWHWENSRVLWEACEDAYRAAGMKGASVVIVDDPGRLIPQEVVDQVFGLDFAGWEVEHAATAETSLMQYFHPELVDDDAIVDDAPEQSFPYDVLPIPKSQVPPSGVYHKASSASPRKGELLANALIGGLCLVVEREFNA